VAGGALRERRLQDTRRISETLRGLLVQVVQASNLDWTAIGINAFLVRRRYRWVGARVLDRVGRERIRSTPAPSRVLWSRGKGVIGRCWESGQDLGFDLREHFAEISDLTADQWADLPHEQRLGLSHDEYLRTRQHGLVVATPVLDRSGKVIGVISADAPSGARDRLWNEQVREVLGSGAVALRNLIE
jgi:hypothetical protein